MRIPPIPSDLLTAELTYVAGSTGTLSRLWRSFRAAWRCARWAARARLDRAPPDRGASAP